MNNLIQRNETSVKHSKRQQDKHDRTRFRKNKTRTTTKRTKQNASKAAQRKTRHSKQPTV